MAQHRANVIRFPGGHDADGIVLTEAAYDLIVSAIGPCHGSEVERFLATALVVSAGRCLDGNNQIIDDVLAAIGVEVHGYMKLDEERDGQARTTPKRGSTAARLLTVYEHIERQLT